MGMIPFAETLEALQLIKLPHGFMISVEVRLESGTGRRCRYEGKKGVDKGNSARIWGQGLGGSEER